MGYTIRHCRECGGDQLFDQPHEDQGCCPDAPGAECPEWICTGCGAALFIGPGDVVVAAAVGRWPGRVA